MISNEKSRQDSVRLYGLADLPAPTAPDPQLTALVERAQRLMGTEHAAVNILDGDRAVELAVSPGSVPTTRPRTETVCHRVAAAFPGRTSYLTDDPQRSPLVADHPWVDGELGAISFYAGVPLVGLEGRPLGVLCAWSMGSVPHPSPDVELLRNVGRAVVAVLDARRRIAEVPEGRAGPRATAATTAGPSVHDVIDAGAVRTLYQPVVELATGAVVGFEALSRGPAGTGLEAPLALLDAARGAGRLGELDWLCRVNAMQTAAAADLPPGLSWFVNAETAGMHEPCPEHLLPALVHARRELRVVLEVVERGLSGHLTHLLHAADQARRDVWGVGLDHVGSPESSSALLPLLMPDVVKLDMSLLREPPRGRVSAVTAHVRAHAERTGAVVVAEGVETAEQERLARAFGATYAQGHRYGAPGELPAHVPAPRTPVPLRQRPAAGDPLTPFETAARHCEPERAEKDVLLHVSRYLEDRCARLDEPFVLLAGFQHRRFFGARTRERYRALSLSSALTVVAAEGAQEEVSPTFQVTGLPRTSALRQEWVVVVMGGEVTAAFVGRDLGDGGADPGRRFDFVYTHDPTVVAAVGRSFLLGIVPAEATTWLPDPAPAPDAAAAEATGPVGLLRRYARRR